MKLKYLILCQILVICHLIYGENNNGTNEITPEKIFKKAIESINYGNIDNAIVQFEKLLTFNPQGEDYYEYLGYLYFVQGSYQKSIEMMKKVLNVEPNSIIAHLVLGEIFYQQNEIVNAREIYTELVQIEPNIKIAHIRLYELLKNNNPKKANKHYLKVFQLPPTKIEKYLPKIEDIGDISVIPPKNIVLIKDLGIEKKIKVKEDFIKNIFSETEKQTNFPEKAVILRVKKHKRINLKFNFKFFSSPFKNLDKEKFYVKLVEVIVVSIVLIFYSIITKRKREMLKRIVVSNYRISSRINE